MTFKNILYVFCILSLTFGIPSGGAACPTEMQYEMSQSLPNRVLKSSQALFKKSIGSLSGCMSMCSKQVNCKSGFYNQNSTTCVGNNDTVVPYSDTKHDKGSKFFTENQVCKIRGFIYNSKEDFCFQVYPQKKTWAAASSFCEDINGLLLVPTPYAKYKIVIQKLNKFPNDFYWIGMSDNAKEGNWKWLTKESANNFKGNGQLSNIDPDKADTEADCGALDSKMGIIKDRNCYTWKPFICGFLKDGPCKVK
ncbi:C-type lectin domain family 4 member F-like isoform X2 [Mizuhopecten yessoensis]|uniref:C-type lectin domain family 4 member F-like isoform X2 n=1 Tax=Mizuhopecten yessoensis TaxID=6573 RepID=UPI000B45EFBD|nr:C-type lectin domain family 4 member F-like isoform X2 [Mizuhopecten yessoensis]